MVRTFYKSLTNIFLVFKIHFTYTEFFITDYNDETTCFHCGIGLRVWHFLTVHGRNMRVGHLTACVCVTSKALLSFTKVNDWDPHKNEIGEKVFTYVT